MTDWSLLSLSAEDSTQTPAPDAFSLEVEGQVSGNDSDVHEVDRMLVLAPVQILVDVQALWGPPDGVGLWQMLPVVPLVLTLRALLCLLLSL